MERLKFLLPLLPVVFFTNINAESITLDGKWTGRLESRGYTFPAIVPGGIYTDLHSSDLISNNLFGNNDIQNRWVGNESVVYSKAFNVDPEFLKASKIVLVFHGVDTFARIFLNDVNIGETSNMFVRYTFDVKEHLKAGINLVNVSFSSPVKVAENLYKNQSASYVVPPVCVPKQYNGECHVNHIRKMQASFAWDWGPAFPSMGIWKNVELISTNGGLVTDISTDVYKISNTWKVIETIFLELPSNNKSGTNKNINCCISLTLIANDNLHITNTTHITLRGNKTSQNVSIQLIIPSDSVNQWWPNGYGEQDLYLLKTTINILNETIHKEKNIGFRTVELVQDPLEKGLTFYFRINGVPIFAKGSNFIPSSVFPELSAEKDTLTNLFKSAKDVHMNMLRVWGGGLYESDLFYNLADEYGIMIWQDFMFACSMYPTTANFLKSVSEEVTQNVHRLKYHPSIVIWAGNNENEAALYGNWYGSGTAQVYRDDYVKLYVDVIKNKVEELDNTRPFVVSSPGNGKYTEEYNYTGQDPYSNLYGDVHYYNYLENGWNINHYPRARFSSEYGFQSLPSYSTIAAVAENVTKDLRVDSAFMKLRQHLPYGNEFMRALISKNFVIPNGTDASRDFRSFIYLSQINQAVSVKIETESYRQAMSDLNEKGEGMTMGALYWQLNDVWQAPSWSSIEYGGKWKMLHYYAKEFFAPVIVTSRLTQADELTLYIVSDLLYDITDCTLKINVYNWNSMTPLNTKVYNSLTVESSRAKIVTSMWLDQFLKNANCGSYPSAKNHCVLTLVLEDRNGSQIAPTNYVYPALLKNVNVPVANITIKTCTYDLPGKLSNYPDFQIELETDNIALFVWLEAGPIQGRFSENGFHMFDAKKNIVFHAYEAVTQTLLNQHLKITTLSGVYSST